jgi:hypothetical protein
MNDTLNRKWFVAFLLFFFGIVVFTFFYFLATRLFDPTPYIKRFSNKSSTAVKAPDAAPKTISERVVNAGTFTLKRDQAARIGNAKVIYRGIEAGSKFRMDVIVLDLDPDYAYPYYFGIASAKNGFGLVGRQLKILNIRKSYITLSLYR